MSGCSLHYQWPSQRVDLGTMVVGDDSLRGDSIGCDQPGQYSETNFCGVIEKAVTGRIGEDLCTYWKDNPEAQNYPDA